MAVETIETVSRSSNKIFIFADGVPDALSPAETILEMYPDTACTTSMAMVVGGSQSAGSQGLRVGISSEDSRDRGNRQSWTGKEGALKASIGGRRVVGLADMKCDALLGSGDLMMPAG
jgi:hypothetical protein